MPTDARVSGRRSFPPPAALVRPEAASPPARQVLVDLAPVVLFRDGPPISSHWPARFAADQLVAAGERDPAFTGGISAAHSSRLRSRRRSPASISAVRVKRGGVAKSRDERGQTRGKSAAAGSGAASFSPGVPAASWPCGSRSRRKWIDSPGNQIPFIGLEGDDHAR